MILENVQIMLIKKKKLSLDTLTKFTFKIKIAVRFRKNKTDKAVESELSGSLSNQPIETHQYTSVNQSAARYSSVNQSTSSSASTCSSKFSQGDAKAVKS